VSLWTNLWKERTTTMNEIDWLANKYEATLTATPWTTLTIVDMPEDMEPGPVVMLYLCQTLTDKDLEGEDE